MNLADFDIVTAPSVPLAHLRACALGLGSRLESSETAKRVCDFYEASLQAARKSFIGGDASDDYDDALDEYLLLAFQFSQWLAPLRSEWIKHVKCFDAATFHAVVEGINIAYDIVHTSTREPHNGDIVAVLLFLCAVRDDFLLYSFPAHAGLELPQPLLEDNCDDARLNAEYKACMARDLALHLNAVYRTVGKYKKAKVDLI